MSNFDHVLVVGMALFVGYLFGESRGLKKANQNNINFGKFYQNQARKQAAQIEMIQDRLVYLSIGELEDFLEYMKDDSEEGFGADENYPVLAIVNPLDKVDLDLEEK